jgi:hypothetical protein
MNPKFAYAFAHRLNITSMAESQAVKSRYNSRSCPLIVKLVKPLAEGLGLPQLDHVMNVV